jgi:hypothetical protein
MADAPPVSPTTPRFGIALAGLVLMLLGPVFWMLSLDHPFLRRSGLLMWLAAAVGLVLVGWAAAKDHRRRMRVVAVLAILWLGIAAPGYLILTKLPQAAARAGGAQIEDFTLPDHDGRAVRLSELLANGPVLLVTYRGHW